MKFMLTANATNESEGAPPDPRLMAAVASLTDEMARAGVLIGSGGLAPSSMGAKVRVSGGKVTVTDGPFAETKEILGGYAFVEVGSKEEAIAIARRFWQLHIDILGPTYEGGGEIRQMFHQEECGAPHEPATSPTTDRTEINVLFQRLAKAHVDHDADAIVDCYAPDAQIYDLAPPLGRRGMTREAVATWLAGWDGPILIDARDVNLTVEGALAFSSALTRMRGRINGENQDMWFRTTMCLRKLNGQWRIVHDHTSVPFYMDGSYRAAVDLKP